MALSLWASGWYLSFGGFSACSVGYLLFCVALWFLDLVWFGFDGDFALGFCGFVMAD